MREKLLRLLAAWSVRPRSRAYQLLALCLGAVVSLVFVPWLMATGLLWVSPTWHSLLPRGLERTFGVLSALDGLCLVLWAALVFWRVGGGTPNPVAATQRLVVEGPYAHCRNPMQLGVMFHCVGVGSFFLSFTAGVVMGLFWLILTTVYHRFIEEKEMHRRFGSAYAEYCKRTPFLFPRLRRRVSSERPAAEPRERVHQAVKQPSGPQSLDPR